MSGHDNDDDERKDLTRIEDLSEFLHQEDPDLDSQFIAFNPAQEVTGTGIAVENLDADLPPEVPVGMEEQSTTEETPLDFEQNESTEEASSLDLDFSTPEETPEETSETPDFSFEEAASLESDSDENSATFFDTENLETDSGIEENLFSSSSAQDLDALDEEMPAEDHFASTEDDKFFKEEIVEEPVLVSPPQNFDDVKTFAQNFSYGLIQGGGNPPYSIIIRNLKYVEDKEDILNLLREFSLVTEKNEEDTKNALEFGSLLIPQISEYSAIVLAHKLRRFDCDLEVGLSDEIHPSKSGENNPRGLVKKESLKQNKTELYKKAPRDTKAQDILVSTTSTLEGYTVLKYLGVTTSFTIVDEDELERLKFVQMTNRKHDELVDYKSDEETMTSVEAFADYQKSFDFLFVDLVDQLKVKAMHQHANALLGLSYQMSGLPHHKKDEKASYQLTCSATLAVVTPPE